MIAQNLQLISFKIILMNNDWFCLIKFSHPWNVHISKVYPLNGQVKDTDCFIYYRKHILQITQPSRCRCTQLQYIFAVIVEAPSTYESWKTDIFFALNFPKMSAYCMPKKSCPFLYSDLLCKNGQYFLEKRYNIYMFDGSWKCLLSTWFFDLKNMVSNHL